MGQIRGISLHVVTFFKLHMVVLSNGSWRKGKSFSHAMDTLEIQDTYN